MTKKCLLSAFGILLCLLMLMVTQSSAQRTVTFTTNGVDAFAEWVDNNGVSGFVEIVANGSAARPSYFLFYSLLGPTNSFYYDGAGNIPAASVQAVGYSVHAGDIAASVNVDTCQLDPSVFGTFSGPCGTINVSWKQVPGFVMTTHGSTDVQSGTMTKKTQGTYELASATVQGSVLGSLLTNSFVSFSNVGFTRQATVTLNLPR